MFKEFQKYITTRALLKPDDRILLAVSGGIDSMAMSDLFLQSEYNFAIAHCNFELRGDESDAEQKLVEDFAKEHNIPIFIRRFDTKNEALNSGESIQMAARRLRYDWFDELTRSENFDKIAIAHHGNDSTETFFINLLRGTGLRGLTGINSVNGKIVRPLLFASREQIVEYVAQRNVRYLNDSSNGMIKYLRNRLRHDILPRLADSAPAFMDTMADNISRLERAQRFIDLQMERIRESAVKDGVIDLQKIEQHGDMGFILFELLYPYGFAPQVIEDITRTEQPHSGKQFFAPLYVATLDRNRIIVTKREQMVIEQESIELDDPRIEWVDMSRLMSLETPSNEALLCVDSVTFPLTLRKWQQGEWFVPLGMRGQKKVSDYLIDNKVALPDKERQLVLVAAESVMWLVGRRIDDRYKVTERSEKVIRLRL